MLTAAPASDFDFSEGVITRYHGTADIVEIPAAINGQPVVALGDGGVFSNITGVKSVVIPTSVTRIGNNSFAGCSGLLSVTLPSSITSIGSMAFWGCGRLAGVTIPSGVTIIGGSAFYGCALTSVTIPSGVTSIEEATFSQCTHMTNITIPNSVTSIGDRAFSKCSTLASITIPNSVTRIGSDAVSYGVFSDCSSLTSVTIGNRVTSIGYGAFSGCTSLTSVTIPDSVTRIGESAFSGCSALASATIGSGVTSIGDGAFQYCVSMAGITIGNAVTRIGNSAFAGDYGLMSLTIGNGVTFIGDGAFSGCIGLTGVTIPEGVAGIGDYAFAGCRGLTSVAIPGSVTSIGHRAFSYDTALTSVTIPESVTSIGAAAFEGCNTMASVAIPDSVTSIGPYAFWHATALANAKIGARVASIGDAAFAGTALTSVTIPASVTSIGSDAFGDCASLTGCAVSSSNLFFSSDSYGVLFNKQRTVLVTFPAGSSNETYAIPSSVTSIGDYAFHNASRLASLTIPSSVTSIGDYAFRGCAGLAAVTIPGSVVTIGVLAFLDATNLTSVWFQGGAPSVGADAFLGVASGAKAYRAPGLTGYGADGDVFCRLIVSTNGTPTDITLSISSIAENSPIGSTVGTFASTDPDVGDAFVYSLVPGVGSTDNAAFTIVGSALKTATAIDFETKKSYVVRVRASDAGGLFTENTFTVSITDVNDAPTGIVLSASSIVENSAVGTTVGILSGTDPDTGDTLTYALVAAGSFTDNASFTIVGSSLRTATALNFETKNSYSIRVRSTDQGGRFIDESFTITVTDVMEPATAPTVTSPASFTVLEDTPTGLAFSGTPFTDADSPAAKVMTVTLSIADGVIASTTADGVTVAGTAVARTFSGTRAALNAFFAASPGRITYTPKLNSTAARTLTTKISEANGTGTLSSTATSTITITPVNDAPAVAAPATFTVTEDVKGNLVWPAALTPFADVDSASLTVTLAVADGTISAASTAAVTVAGTATVRTFTGTPSRLSAYFKTPGAIGYTTSRDNTEARTLTTTVFDGSLSASASSLISIRPVSDPPTLIAAATFGGGRIGTAYEITYEALQAALRVADPDTASPALLIQAVNSGMVQKWNGTSWVTVSAAVTTPLSQRLLSAGEKIRWLPPAGVSGDRAAFKVKARDGVLNSTVTAQVTIVIAAS